MTRQRIGAWIGATCIALAGLSTTAQATLVAPPTLAFGGQSMGTPSPVQAVTITNNGGSPMNVAGISSSNGQFTITGSCGAIAVGANCVVNVKFVPVSAPGALNSTVPVAGTLTINTDVAGSPHLVPLTGTAEKSLVTHFYRSVLRRAPDPSGKTYWEGEAVRVSSLGANVNEVWYALGTYFFRSAEYTAFNRTSSEFITDLYNAFLNRPPDAGGLTFWTGQLASGLPREVALVSFLLSSEFTTFAANVFGNTAARAEVDVVGDFYRGLLARTPDDAGFAGWVSQFRSAQCLGGQAPVNTAVESISTSFVNGTEYTSKNRDNAQYVGDLYNAFLRRGGDLNGVNYWISRLDTNAMTRNQVRQQFILSAEFQGRVSAVVSQGCLGNQFFMSPTGSDSNNGRSPAAAFKTFLKAFDAMQPADELILLDGNYGLGPGTGVINFQGANSAQPKSGTSRTSMTTIRAQNPGNVFVNGPFFIGRSTRKDSYIKIQGITFTGGESVLYNADYVYIKDCGFNGGFSAGSNDHAMFSDYNLIEDSWIWAAQKRGIVVNYRSHYNVYRRVVVRGDGCDTTECLSKPNIGITIYDSNNISMQNILVVDRILAPGASPYSDLAIAQHTPDPVYYYGQSEWLGVMSIKAPDAGIYMEPDCCNVLDPTVRISNAVVWDSASNAMNMDRAGVNQTLENLTLKTAGVDINANGLRVGSGLTTGVLRNAIVMGTGRFGINSAYKPTFIDLSFTATQTLYQNQTCAGTCLTTNPRADTPGPSLKYLPRIENGSKLKGAGANGADIGANVVFRYGQDGQRFGDGGYNVLTSTPLWPWPNEARIKKEMCTDMGITRGFCATGTRLDGTNPVTLTTYIWEMLGNPIPAGIYP